MTMDRAINWLESHFSDLERDLAELVAIASISTDGGHQAEIDRSADQVAALMTKAGLKNVEILRGENTNPYAYGEWLEAPGKPTVLLYSHHDVQPPGPEEKWSSPPWTLTRRDGRLYARGAVDDKGGVVAQLGAVAAWLRAEGGLPVNVKMIVEGEEEIGSKNLLGFFEQCRDRLRSDLIVVCDTENVRDGTPSITYSLRGLVSVVVEVKTAEGPKHSGFVGGAVADAAIALNQILGRLYWANGELPIPHFYDDVRPVSEAERAVFRSLSDDAALRRQLGVLPGVGLALEPGRSFYEQTSRRPAVTVIAQEASSLKTASNQVLSSASAIVSCRLVPDQKPREILEHLRAFLMKDPPWGVEVDVTVREQPTPWWITDPQGPAFEAAKQALEAGYGEKVVPLGCGGSIGFVRPVAELFGGAPALLLGISGDNLHAPNEYVHEEDWHKLMKSLVHMFQNLGDLPGGKVR
jgi:acetylornithine deacetylase/succinyl-diaminopimelate desuccinylase-like protein